MDAALIRKWAVGVCPLGFFLPPRRVIITGCPEKMWPSASTIVVDVSGRNQKEDEAGRHPRLFDLPWTIGCVKQTGRSRAVTLGIVLVAAGILVVVGVLVVTYKLISRLPRDSESRNGDENSG